ncbi:MAG: TetR/AcrR family transcriptional regulator [Dehalococcoidales bacterium]|nr:TetR/AcrR family transcriptional regulator [Dehalococcoidales bacterium]
MGIKEKPDKQQRILDAALSLFRNTHDIKKVSLEAIAREAKVSPTTIYNNFGTREKLISEVIKVLIKENMDLNRSLVFSDMPFPQKMIGIISGKMNMAANLNNEIIEKIITQDETLAPLINEIYESEIRPLWLRILEDGKKEGYIDASLNDEALLIYLDVLKAGFEVRQDILKNFTDKIGLIEQLTHIMFYGFLKKDIDLFKKGGN